jgi:prepilin-type N-terminal cleavage/methylation domain-containing protein
MDVTGARRRRDERGDTLIEIIIALVIIGGVISAFFAAYGTSATASNAHRDLVTADAALRGYAEATKDGVRTCLKNATGPPQYNETYEVAYTPPRGFSVDPPPGTRQCPTPDVTAPVTISVTLPNGQQRSLDLVVRTP